MPVMMKRLLIGYPPWFGRSAVAGPAEKVRTSPIGGRGRTATCANLLTAPQLTSRFCVAHSIANRRAGDKQTNRAYPYGLAVAELPHFGSPPRGLACHQFEQVRPFARHVTTPRRHAGLLPA
jgi:hypothetical protein